MPHKSNGRGSYRLDRRFRRIGRINRASGTDDRKTFEAINAMLDALYSQGHWPILRQVMEGQVRAVEVFSFWRQGQLHRLTNPTSLKKLSQEIENWIATRKATDTTRRNNRNEIDRMLKVTGDPEIGSVPTALQTYRDECEKRRVFDTFNRTRKLILAFLKARHPTQSALRNEVLAISKLGYDQQSAKHFTVVEMMSLIQRLSPGPRSMARTMLFTTMGWSEYVGQWAILQDNTVHIAGTKNKYRNRYLPQFERNLVKPVCGFKSFSKALRQADPDLQPRSFRNSISRWLREAGIPQWRVEVYCGWKASTMGTQYQRGHGPTKVPPQDIDGDIELLEEYMKSEQNAAVQPRIDVPTNAGFQFVYRI